MYKLLLLFLVSVVLGGCCKNYCIFQMLDLRFVGFHSAEIDTLLVKQYKRGTNYQTLVDSFRYSMPQPDQDTLYVPLYDKPFGVDLSNDFEISGPAFAEKYRISDITTKTESCTCSGQRMKRIQRFKVNDIAGTGEFIYLKK